MALQNIFNDASIVMTVVSLLTFLGILWWVYGIKRSRDFDAMANLPFADDFADQEQKKRGESHV
ncbi:MAG TPA: CcoQ/FixQ family Cbb3-type cytochrome c oxidase assembly chaperone [Burkholderiaceae bacterium]|jgi:cytochrome c oxidase cbb3-type subunit 4